MQRCTGEYFLGIPDFGRWCRERAAGEGTEEEAAPRASHVRDHSTIRIWGFGGKTPSRVRQSNAKPHSGCMKHPCVQDHGALSALDKHGAREGLGDHNVAHALTKWAPEDPVFCRFKGPRVYHSWSSVEPQVVDSLRHSVSLKSCMQLIRENGTKTYLASYLLHWRDSSLDVICPVSYVVPLSGED